MFATAARMSKGPGFFRKSAEELSRVTRIAWRLEGLEVPKDQYHLLDFSKEETVAGCKTMADRAVGGFSTASLDYVPAGTEASMPAHARFHGSISTKLPANWKVQRTGYAAFRNHDRGMWLFGRLYWDVDPYTYLALRVKSDGRRYTVNVQTDSIVESDIHQHRLFTAAEGGGWETVLIRWTDFVRTNLGTVVEPQTGLLTQKVKSIGIGLTDRVEGAYDLRIHRIWATNGLGGEALEEERRICGAASREASRDSKSLVEGADVGRFRDVGGVSRDRLGHRK